MLSFFLFHLFLGHHLSSSLSFTGQRQLFFSVLASARCNDSKCRFQKRATSSPSSFSLFLLFSMDELNCSGQEKRRRVKEKNRSLISMPDPVADRTKMCARALVDCLNWHLLSGSARRKVFGNEWTKTMRTVSTMTFVAKTSFSAVIWLSPSSPFLSSSFFFFFLFHYFSATQPKSTRCSLHCCCCCCCCCKEARKRY